MDTVNWSKARFDEISKEVLDYLKKLGIRAEQTPVIPVSGFLGHNLTERSTEADLSWWSGWTDAHNNVIYTLFDALDK